MPTSPPDPVNFARRVYAWVRQVPRGRVVTYGQVAWGLAPPANVPPDTYRRWGAIWVGGAMAHAPEDVPWQRVVNSQGGISIKNAVQAGAQRLLLEQEGVRFGPNDRIDLAVYGWNPDQPALC